MRIKIVSDGTGRGTKVINAETGEVVEGVKSATWSCSARGEAMVVLTFVHVHVEVEGDSVATDAQALADAVKKHIAAAPHRPVHVER